MVHSMVSMMLLSIAAAEDIVAMLQISAAVRQRPRKQALVNAAEAEKKAAEAMAEAKKKMTKAEAKMTEAEAVDLLQEDAKKGQNVNACAKACDEDLKCISFEYSLKEEKTCKLNRDRIPTCPEGFTPGVLMGLGKTVIRTGSASSCQNACDYNTKCLSFKYSLKEMTCSLTRHRFPTCPEGYSLTPTQISGYSGDLRQIQEPQELTYPECKDFENQDKDCSFISITGLPCSKKENKSCSLHCCQMETFVAKKRALDELDVSITARYANLKKASGMLHDNLQAQENLERMELDSQKAAWQEDSVQMRKQMHLGLHDWMQMQKQNILRAK